MSLAQTLTAALAVSAPIAIAQWWLMSRLHKKTVAAVRERHLAAQQSVATMLQQARLQNERTQRELAALRLSAPPAARKASAKQAERAAREDLRKMLDEAPASGASQLPADGFADTLPSRQFPNTSSFGLLQRPSTFAGG